MPTQPNYSAKETEENDADQVDKALGELQRGNIPRAKQILTAVIENTPSGTDYATQIEDEKGGLSIKFWSQNAFVHYVTHESPNRSISWIGCAYPRAFYYLGFIAVKERDFQTALEHLEQGATLEPTNPNFRLEKAHALIGLGQKQEALRLYEEMEPIGAFVSGHEVAVALRGKGFLLIEMDQLEDAQSAFHESLKLEPESEVALGELRYIAHLQSGGHKTHLETVETRDGNGNACGICQNEVKSGTAISYKGKPTLICERCYKKITKKWWQFWL
jgi:tetratricopeptide (TPR) repeat protein